MEHCFFHLFLYLPSRFFCLVNFDSRLFLTLMNVYAMLNWIAAIVVFSMLLVFKLLDNYTGDNLLN